MLGSFILGERQFHAVGPAWKNPRGPIVLVEVAGTNQGRSQGFEKKGSTKYLLSAPFSIIAKSS